GGQASTIWRKGQTHDIDHVRALGGPAISSTIHVPKADRVIIVLPSCRNGLSIRRKNNVCDYSRFQCIVAERICNPRKTTDLLSSGYCPQEECSIPANRSQEFTSGRNSNSGAIRSLPLYLANLLGGGSVPKTDAVSGIGGGQDLAIGRKSHPKRSTP